MVTDGSLSHHSVCQSQHLFLHCISHLYLYHQYLYSIYLYLTYSYILSVPISHLYLYLIYTYISPIGLYLYLIYTYISSLYLNYICYSFLYLISYICDSISALSHLYLQGSTSPPDLLIFSIINYSISYYLKFEMVSTIHYLYEDTDYKGSR
jgi:hypothetical protein